MSRRAWPLLVLLICFGCDGNGDGPDAMPVPGCGDGVVTTGETCDPAVDRCCNSTCDGVQPIDTVCRPRNGLCDVREVCDGASSACPANQVAPNVVECRAAQTVCDVAEFCDGAAVCPSDVVAADTVLCRAAAGDCDVAENCDGATVDCPLDLSASDGTSCNDCPNGAGNCSTCLAGACQNT